MSCLIVMPEPLPEDMHQFFVGPFTVRIRRKRDYTVFTCDVLGVTINSQLSYPSLAQLTDSLNKAVSEKLLSYGHVEKLLHQVVVESCKKERV